MSSLADYVAGYEEDMARSLSDMIKIPAISPRNGGDGESRRADFLSSLAKSFGFETQRYDYKDNYGCVRSNLILRHGYSSRNLWIIPHMDTVPVGDRTLWTADPFAGTIKDGKVWGRGSSDNGQDVIASMYAMRAAKESGIRSGYGFCIAIVADEETGNEYGTKKLLKEDIFDKKDMVLVPDAGTGAGTDIEIVEKSGIGVRIAAYGKQAHASRPNTGINACFHCMKFATGLSEYLYKKYNRYEPMFYPEYSTFEVTKHEGSPNSSNTIPGSDWCMMDCRVLPTYKVRGIVEDMKDKAAEYCRGVPGLDIRIEANAVDAPKQIDPDSEMVKLVYQKVKEAINREPRLVGRGGKTCAAQFREIGMDAVVWSMKEEVAHGANEYCIISEMVTDAKVFASLFA